MDSKIVEIVQNRLLEIEKEHSVRILYAVESGSRAWGFESTDSDYDIRFIYAHPKDWYLNILEKRDVIEYPIVSEFDYSGWDLRKTLFLLNKSNPVLFEWLKSPIVYHKDGLFCSVMGELLKPYFSPISSIYHYLHMASRNYREYLQADEVKIKKYFYVLRPIMACMWIEDKQESPPMEFDRLMVLLDDKALAAEISMLLVKKKSGVELGLEPKIQIINDFIEKKLQHFEATVQSFNPKSKPDQRLMEEGFIRMLEECAGMGKC